ncbi:hypothetical protein BDY17DRAFT_12207 [Neohortaea acidophila]|uniref:Uncharacterized protein n=1 Tax=Neohortaea acidophila TaxID=245834 RepID=A0A6A6Q529_9PEZI|nr:uncharacterized protein BDY17DRAFT_12207 [Neohortaea acidophila]KAF2487480.1 hypothetical protein BDY17DRAFT_12207 [Neohortaea acidophila]
MICHWTRWIGEAWVDVHKEENVDTSRLKLDECYPTNDVLPASSLRIYITFTDISSPGIPSSLPRVRGGGSGPWPYRQLASTCQIWHGGPSKAGVGAR